MAVVNWNNRFETGIGLIDAQHKALFAALNELAEAFRDGTAASHVSESMDALMAYAVEHFQTEEKYMRERDYPALAEHMVEHARLVEQTQALRIRFEEGKLVTMDVTIFLADLMTHHIHDFDLLMVNFLKGKNQL